MVTFSNLSIVGFLCYFIQQSLHGIEATGNQGVPFSPKVPIVCKSQTSCTDSVPLNLAFTGTALEISGGASIEKRNIATTQAESKQQGSYEYDSDDEVLSFAQESDIVIEVRGGGMTAVNTTPQPLRISTYRKGIRQLRNYERREQRRQKRLERMERRKHRREAKKNFQVYASKLKVRCV